MTEGTPDTNRSSPQKSQEHDFAERKQQDTQSSLLPLGAAIGSRIKLIDNEVTNFISKNTGTPIILYDAAYHLVRAGGKRLRSLLTYLACEAVGGELDRILPISVAAELLQTASLIHDDIIDNADIRRGVPTVHQEFGEKLAILAADLLISQAFTIIGKWGTPKLVEQVGRTGIAMCEGEARDSVLEVKELLSFDEREYLKLVEGKTVSFMKEAANTGASIGKASKSEKDALIEFAENLGYAFQIRDDVLDFTADPETSGKSVLTDLQQGSSNLVLVYALDSCNEETRKQCVNDLSEGNYALFLKLIEDSGAIARASNLARKYADQARSVIEKYKFKNKELLFALVDFSIERSF